MAMAGRPMRVFLCLNFDRQHNETAVAYAPLCDYMIGKVPYLPSWPAQQTDFHAGIMVEMDTGRGNR